MNYRSLVFQYKGKKMSELTFNGTKEALRKNAANIITISGIVGAVWLLIVAITYPEELWLIMVLSVFIGLTDFIDGLVARRLKIESSLGSALDRIRDKLFIPPVLVFLVWHYWPTKSHSVALATLTVALVVCSVAIEIVLFAGWVFGLLTKKSVQSNQYGRTKMFLQFIIVMLWFTGLLVEKQTGLQTAEPSLFFVDALLAVTLYFAAKSVAGYYNRYFPPKEKAQ